MRRLRVLAVDDEATSLETVASILGCAGFDVTTTADPDHARNLLSRGLHDLVLTDLFFDDDPIGYEIARHAREARPAVPVVMLTGRPSFGYACEALRSQVAEILVKPVDGQALVDACQKVVMAAEIEARTSALEGRNRVLSRVIPKLVEAKDSTTSGHSERVVAYADTLGELCKLTPEERDSLRLAALLHDVGKIGIPREILNKPGPLTADEREVVNRHPALGRDILSDLEDSESVRDWVYQHHERWDGRGYPNGLRGEEVALPGRILVLAEVYDALAEERSYKPAWSTTRIVDFFREEAGRHFDPDLANLVADGLEEQGKRFFVRSDDLLFG